MTGDCTEVERTESQSNVSYLPRDGIDRTSRRCDGILKSSGSVDQNLRAERGTRRGERRGDLWVEQEWQRREREGSLW
jgi:hypothetical protein